MVSRHDILEHLVIKHPRHVNTIGGEYQSPLLAALHGKHTRVVRLKHGGNVDVRGTKDQDSTSRCGPVAPRYRGRGSAVFTQTRRGRGAQRGGRAISVTPLHLVADSIGELRLLEHTADVHHRWNDNGKTTTLRTALDGRFTARILWSFRQLRSGFLCSY